MSDPRAELSSVSTALDDLARRLTAIAEAAAGRGDEALAGELYEVERALGGAQRRLGRVVEGRGPGDQ